MISRRAFGLSALAATLFGPGLGRAKAGQRVIVVGAGVAGITAGYLLQRAGAEVTILEAAPHWGGRIKRLEGFADFPIDLGAEWIHADHSILKEIVDDRTAKVDEETITYRPKTYDTWDGESRGSANWLRLAYAERKFKRTTWYGFFERHMLPSVSGSLRLNEPVSRIEHSGTGVTVRTAKARYSADQVIVTTPLSVLQKGGISFAPSLPRRIKAALDDTVFGSGLKAFFKFKERFYGDITLPQGASGFTADTWSERIFYNAAFGKDSGDHVLGLFQNSNVPLATARQSDAQIQRDLLAELDRIYDGAASQLVEKVHVQNWDRVPYIHGTYSNDYDEGAQGTLVYAFRPVAGRLFFAGEALGGEDRSTVHGAAFSAFEAVDQLLQS